MVLLTTAVAVVCVDVCENVVVMGDATSQCVYMSAGTQYTCVS